MSLGEALEHYHSGRLSEARNLCRELLAQAPPDPEALHLLGLIEYQRGGRRDAVELLGEAIKLRPDNPLFLHNLGEIQRAEGDFCAAERWLRQATILKPDYSDAHHHLGMVLAALGQLGAAETSLRSAIQHGGDSADAYNNLGFVLIGTGRLSEGEVACRRALELRPAFPEAQNNLGNALAGLGRLAEAIQSYKEALRLQPRFVDALNNLGAAYRDARNLVEAEASYRSALDLNPQHARACCNLGIVLQEQGRFEEAEHNFRRAIGLDPSYVEAVAKWAHLSQHLCAWSHDFDAAIDHLRRDVREHQSGRTSPFIFLSVSPSGAEQLACARRFAEERYRDFLARPIVSSTPETPRRKLRVGYLSADYYEHATSHLIAEVVELHDRRRFEILAYSYSPEKNDPMRARLLRAFDEWHDIRALSHLAAASQIADDGVDILVDLKGYTADGRPQVAALRPAPVQISWLGYPGTLGHPRIADYIIGDPIVTPPEHASHFSETLALMPHCYQPNDRQRSVGKTPTRVAAGLPPEGIVFCCFNQSYKITAATFDLWCRLLLRVPGSVLWLLEASPRAKENLRRESAARGVAPDRLVFGPRLPLESHLGRLQLADLALDTFPYTSHTTGSDALWAGIPLLTLAGGTFVSRVGASIVSAAGLPDMVVRNADSYLELATTLAKHPNQLRALRRKLARARSTCALFDSQRFVQSLEQLFVNIWTDHRAGIRRVVRSDSRPTSRTSHRSP